MILPQRYTSVAVALHWLVAILIAINIALVLLVDSVPEGYIRPMIDSHKSIGITVLGLVILRVLWRATHPPPPLPSGYKAWERRLSHAVHILLYVLMFALPLSGWMHDSAWRAAASHPMYLFGVVPWPRISWIMDLDPTTREHAHALLFKIHKSLAKILYFVVALHILGALKHQFFDRHPELQRMMPGQGR